MSILSLPASPAFSSSRFGLVSNTQSFRSPLSGQVQTLERPGARWQAEYQLPPMSRSQAAAWQSFLLQLRGGAGRFYGYDPDARTPRGAALSSATASRNELRNSEAQSAAVGTIGSGGSAPLHWSFSPVSGLVREVVGQGMDAGIRYLDVRFSGTPTANFAFLNFETTTAPQASAGEQWTGSFYFRLVGGSTAGIIAVQQRLEQNSASGAQTTAQYNTANTVDGSWRRQSGTRTLSATTPATASVRNGLFLSLTIGSPIDITLRIGAPMLERAASASLYIPTTGSARTRSAGARVDGAQAGGNQITSWNWQANISNLLRVGDYIAFDSASGHSLHRLTAEASSDGNGRAVLRFEPPLRGTLGDDTAILTTSASAVMALQEESVSWRSNAQGIVQVSFTAEERF